MQKHHYIICNNSRIFNNAFIAQQLIWDNNNNHLIFNWCKHTVVFQKVINLLLGFFVFVKKDSIL